MTAHSTIVPITSPDLKAAEISFFSALCSDDFQYLGVPDASEIKLGSLF